MIGELASAIPEEGGFYVWVRRALGPFWGFQEAWLSLAASIFDMALYPVLFVLYLSRLAPQLTAGPLATVWKLAVVAGCVVWNLRGARSVGRLSVLFFIVLMSPFVVLIVAGLYRAQAIGHGWALLRVPSATPNIALAISVTMWNYMGWDNASTVGQEVENPQRNYPRAMLLAAALAAITYVLPLAAVGLAGMPAGQFTTGAWVDAAMQLGSPAFGRWLGIAIVAGGVVMGVGMFNALMLSYTRLPYAMAKERLLPRIFTRVTSNGVPWVSVLVCAIGWALALRLSFERLISIDLVLYGASLILEFVALAVLRVREPDLARPFRIPGGTLVAILTGVGPTALIVFALWDARNETVAGIPALLFASIVALAGPVVYFAIMRLRGHREARIGLH
jgi:amino acid transporter